MEDNYNNKIKSNIVYYSNNQKIIKNEYIKIYSDENKQIINRNYGIDLLKIISMINIIILHINLFSRKLSLKINNPRTKIIWRIEAMSYWSVNCFGMISGIVGYKKCKFSNLIYLWFQVTFYSVLITIFLYLKKNSQITKQNLLLSLFPILIKRHWYVNAYFSMYLFLPFINNGINYLKKTEFRNLTILFFCFYSLYNIIAVILHKENYHFLNKGYSSIWLMILYIIGAYIGKYLIKKKNYFNLMNSSIYLLILLNFG